MHDKKIGFVAVLTGGALALAVGVAFAVPGMLQPDAGGGANTTAGPEGSSWSGHEDEFVMLRVKVDAAGGTDLMFPYPDFVEVPDGDYEVDVEGQRLTLSPDWGAPEGWPGPDGWQAAYLVHDGGQGERLFLAAANRLPLVTGAPEDPGDTGWPWQEERWVVTLGVAPTPSKVLVDILPTIVQANGVTIGDYLLPCEAQYRHGEPYAEAGAPFNTTSDVRFAYSLFPGQSFDLRFTGEVHPSAGVEDAPCPEATLGFENLGLWDKRGLGGSA